jgi:hypothetical protein
MNINFKQNRSSGNEYTIQAQKLGGSGDDLIQGLRKEKIIKYF